MFIRRSFARTVVLAVTLTLPLRVSAQAPSAIVQRAVDAVGGAAAVRSVNNTVSDLYASLFVLGQEEAPLSPARASHSLARITYDFAGRRYAIQQENRAPAGPPGRIRRVMTGGVGMVVNNTNEAPDTRAGLAASERAMRTTPLALLRTALESPASLRAAQPKRWRGDVMDAVRIAGQDTATMYFDRASGLLTVVEVVTDDPVLGDRRTAIHSRLVPATAEWCSTACRRCTRRESSRRMCRVRASSSSPMC